MMIELDIVPFTKLESNVRSYCRSFPTVFTQALGCKLIDENGCHYIDFFAGAGSLNYGHNNPRFKKHLLAYIEANGITQSLDLFTIAKRTFLERFETVILRPRGLDYKIMFPAPTGTNAIEAALKLARKVTGRSTIASFDQGFHGVTLGSLAVTSDRFHRQAAGVPLEHCTFLPFHQQMGQEIHELEQLQQILQQLEREGKKPAACILETVQAEGGIHVASIPWLQGISQVLQEEEILLIIDDIQVGCGRTGPFFSFERAGLQPDIVCLSKSLSGYGIPMALVLLRPPLDCWEPGEHNGTFRGHNLAFVTATAALDYWETQALEQAVYQKATIIRDRLQQIITNSPSLGHVRGLGCIQGIACHQPELAQQISQAAFARGLIVETAGLHREVLKILPPLTIDLDDLHQGLAIVQESVAAVL
jgi:diaminobutyrate-2-oxoglutarate transaminase